MRIRLLRHYGQLKPGHEMEVSYSLGSNLVYAQVAETVNDGLIPEAVSIPAKGKPKGSRDKMISNTHPRRRSKGKKRKANA